MITRAARIGLAPVWLALAMMLAMLPAFGQSEPMTPQGPGWYYGYQPGNVGFNQAFAAKQDFPMPPLTVAALPACTSGLFGQWYMVTDATALSYAGPLVGGGSYIVPAICNGVAWGVVGGGAGGGGGSPGGATNSVQINAGSGAFGGVALGAGQLMIGQASGAPLAETITGCTLTAGGVLTCAGGGGGTVTNVSGVNANGLTFSISSPTVAPAITIATSVSGLIKGSSGALTAAVAGTDYVAPGANSSITSLSGLTTPLSVAQGGTGTGSPALIAGTNVTITGTWPNETINASGGGGTLTVTDGTHSVASTATLTLGPGFLVGGSAGSATANLIAPNRSVATGGATIGAGDIAGQVNSTDASAQTFTQPSTATAGAGVSFTETNQAAGVVTLSGGQTLNGIAAASLNPFGWIACLGNGASADCIGFPGFGTITANALTKFAAANGAETASGLSDNGTTVSTGEAVSLTGLLSVAGVNGSSDTQAGATYTMTAGDCGKTIIGTDASAAVYTIPAAIVPASGVTCIISVMQAGGAGKISVNGSAVSAAALQSALGYTGTSGTQWSMITLTLSTIASVATAVLTGNGS